MSNTNHRPRHRSKAVSVADWSAKVTIEKFHAFRAESLNYRNV